MTEQTKQQCPACGNYDNVTVLELTLNCNMCEERSILYNKEINFNNCVNENALECKVLEPNDNPLLCIDCSIHMIWDNRLAIKRDEYERLKEIEAMYEGLCK